VAIVSIESTAVKFWDLGGSLQSIWKNYYDESDGIIFVVDGCDWKRIEAVRNCFVGVAESDVLAGIPVLILVNKQDLQENVDFVAKIKEVFNPIMEDIGARECKVASCSALHGYGC
jgi:GTPase SAR1 family protein